MPPIDAPIKNVWPDLSITAATRYSWRMKASIHLLAGAVLLAVGSGAATASAQAILSTGQSFITADLVAGAPTADGARMAGLELSLTDGWKTYWRSPGGAGVAPSFDWSGSTNLAGAEVLWPRPQLFDSFGMRTVGYAHEVLLPLKLTPKDPSKPIDLKLKASLGVCSDICVLEELDLAETIAPAESEAASRVSRALNARPEGAMESGLVAASCRIIGAGSDREFRAELTFSRPLTDPVVLVEGPATLWFGETDTVVDGATLTVSAPMGVTRKGAWVDRGALRLTVLAGAFAADIPGCRAPG